MEKSVCSSSSSGSLSSLSTVDKYLRLTQIQLRQVGYPNNITRLRVLQRAVINECIRMSIGNLESLSVEINECSKNLSCIIDKIHQSRKEKKKKRRIENSEAVNTSNNIGSNGNIDDMLLVTGNRNNRNEKSVVEKMQDGILPAPQIMLNNASKKARLKKKKKQAAKDSNNSNNMRKRKDQPNNSLQQNPGSVKRGKISTTDIVAKKSSNASIATINKQKIKGQINFTRRDLAKGESAIIWQGDPYKETHGKIYFKACVIGRAHLFATLIRPGDVYLLSSGDDSKNPYVAFCQDVYFDKKSNEAKMTAQWFFRHEDLLNDGMKNSNVQKVEGHTSIFLSSQVEENPIESILGRACVFYSTDDKNIKNEKNNIMNETSMNAFYCGQFLNVVSGKLAKLKSSNFKTRPASIIGENVFRKKLDYKTFFFPLHFFGITNNKNEKCGINNSQMINITSRKNMMSSLIHQQKNNENNKNKVSSGNNTKSNINLSISSSHNNYSNNNSNKKDYGRNSNNIRNKVMKGGFIPLLGKRSYEILALKHGGEYKYFINGGSSFMRNGSFTNVGSKNLSVNANRKNIGNYRGYEQACALLIDLNNHRMTSTRENHVQVGGTRTIESFLKPVNLVDFPDYLDIVKTPMDFSTIDQKLHIYKSFDEFENDVELIFDNCRLYNPPEKSYEVCALAEGLRDYFRKACNVIKFYFDEQDEKNKSDSSSIRNKNENVDIADDNHVLKNKVSENLDNNDSDSDGDGLMNSITESSQPFLVEKAVEL
jgi:hypothetical protein